MLSNHRIALLGMGTMGCAIARGLLASGSAPAGLVGTVRRTEHAERLGSEFDFPIHTDGEAAARGADLVLVCTKPHRVAPLLAELGERGALDHDPLIVSIAAGIFRLTRYRI